MKIKLFETLNSVLDMQITESQDNLLHLEGVFGVCGIVNNNNRIYTKENYAEMIEQLQDKISKHALLGEMEHSMSLTTRLDNVSHRIDSVSIDEDGVVHGSLTILKTPKGQIAEAIIKAGSPLYVSSKAVGTIDENNVVTLTHLFGWDLVGSPGFSEAEVNIKEGLKFESLNDNILIIKEEEDEEKKDSEEPEKKEEPKDEPKEEEPKEEPKESDNKEEEPKDEDPKDDEPEDKKDDDDKKEDDVKESEEQIDYTDLINQINEW